MRDLPDSVVDKQAKKMNWAAVFVKSGMIFWIGLTIFTGAPTDMFETGRILAMSLLIGLYSEYVKV